MAQGRLKAATAHLGQCRLEAFDLQCGELLCLDGVLVGHRKVRPKPFEFKDGRRLKGIEELIELVELDAHAVHPGIDLDVDSEHVVVTRRCQRGSLHA